MDFFLTKVCNDEWNLAQDSGRSIEDGEKDIKGQLFELSDLEQKQNKTIIWKISGQPAT